MPTSWPASSKTARCPIALMADFTDELILPQIVLPGDETERRRLRECVLAHAAYLHQGDNLFSELSAIEEVLKTAEAFYNWVCQEPEHVSKAKWQAQQIEGWRLRSLVIDETNQLYGNAST